MSKKKRSTISNFICPECGLEFPIPRKIGQQREKGHIKDLYCPICNKIQKFTEYTYKQSYKTLEGEIIEEKKKPLTDFKNNYGGRSLKRRDHIIFKKNGVLVFDKEEFIENFNSYMIEWCFDRRRIEKLKKMIDTGVPIRNWGIVTKNGKTYYIRYTCLERGKVILK